MIDMPLDVRNSLVCEVREGNLPTRQNNPLNVKYGRITRHWVDEGKAVIGDLGFLHFCEAVDGWNAALELLRSYSGLTQEEAMRRWSNGGYGKLTNSDKDIAEMTEYELNELVGIMATREGFLP